jgi:hypothetical protein
MLEQGDRLHQNRHQAILPSPEKPTAAILLFVPLNLAIQS